MAKAIPPSLTVWRIAQVEWASTAYTGKGAALDPGRWNLEGDHIVYTSESPSLAAWEVFIHMRRLLFRYEFVIISAIFPAALLESLIPDDYPEGWFDRQPRRSVQEFGSRWLREGRSCVLRVPSVVIQGEFNFLINPLHPDFAKVHVSQPVPFQFDPRLKKS